jgi:protein phosphatase
MHGPIDCHGQTDVGRRRESNEDQFLVADLRKSLHVHQTSLAFENPTPPSGKMHGKLLLVADGMGGHAAGEVASRIAVDRMTSHVLETVHWFLDLDSGGEDRFVENLKKGLDECQTAILADARETPERRGMGTTLTLGYIVWPRLYVVHAGDSRCYLFRKGRLRRITKDHTMAQRFVDEGDMDPHEAESSRWSHMLWNVVGGTPEHVFAEAHLVDLAVGDALLLCSDGLHSQVSDPEIAAILRDSPTAAEACRRAIDAANAAGGVDNVTVVTAYFREGERP